MAKLYLEGILSLPTEQQEAIIKQVEKNNPDDAEAIRNAIKSVPSSISKNILKKNRVLLSDKLTVIKARMVSYLQKQGGYTSLRSLQRGTNFSRSGVYWQQALFDLIESKQVIRIGSGQKGDPYEIGLLESKVESGNESAAH